jgi:predicted amidohydrolase YtcJ
MTGLLIRGCSVEGSDAVDVRVHEGHVVEVAAALRRDGEEVLEARGGVLLPGLVDHHIHLHALAAHLESVDCSRPDFAASLRTAAGRGPVRGVGYHESVAGPIDRDALDAVVKDQPVRVQHRSGAAWFLNSAALLGFDLLDSPDPAIERDATGRPTGRVLRGDHLLRHDTGTFPDLAPVGALLTRYGVTGVTDATPRLNPHALAALRDAHSSGALPQRLLILGAALGDDATDVGPWKVVLDEAAGLDLDAVVAVVRSCRAVGRAVALHAVTAAEAMVAVTALRTVGFVSGDRIEHGSVLPPDLDLAGLTVVTQPGFVTDRGDDYLADVDPLDQPHLYRCRSLLDAGIDVAGSTDAPYGDPDPWRSIAAATTRRTRSGVVLGPAETVSATRALALFLSPQDDPGGPVRRVVPGASADLCLLDVPLDAAVREPSSDHVVATVIAGRVVHQRGT